MVLYLQYKILLQNLLLFMWRIYFVYNVIRDLILQFEIQTQIKLNYN